jgi:hypothetical protein
MLGQQLGRSRRSEKLSGCIQGHVTTRLSRQMRTDQVQDIPKYLRIIMFVSQSHPLIFRDINRSNMSGTAERIGDIHLWLHLHSTTARPRLERR